MFTNKNVLITGVTGFVGNALANELEKQGANVYGVSQTRESKNVKKGSIADAAFVESTFAENSIDICFHLAGESLVESGQNDPYNTFTINVVGALNILESCRRYKIERLVIASTSHVYGKNKVPYYEGYMPRPSRPYETSKACTDLIAQSYADTYDLPVLIPRFVNIYGPGDTNFSRLIPRTIKSVLSNSSPEMWGGNAVRDYLYIDDAVSAYTALAAVDIAKVGKNRIFNFGTGKTIAVKELIEKIIHLSGRNIPIKPITSHRVDEISKQYLATEKAKKLLHWKAKTGLDEGLEKTIAWYNSFLSKNEQ